MRNKLSNSVVILWLMVGRNIIIPLPEHYYQVLLRTD